MSPPAPSGVLAPPALLSPRLVRRRSVRLRLTALYGVLFIFSGAALLAISDGWSYSVRPAVPAPPPASPQQSPLAQAQARIRQLQFRITALSDQVHAIQPHRLLVGSAIAMGIMAVLSVAAGWLLAGRILRPLRAITAATRQISEDDLHRRLALPGPADELTDLADTIDGLLARLQAAFDAQRHFVANASHELRTPLTLERAMLEVALADPAATADALRSTCEDVLAAGQQQERLIEALLTLARSQSGLDHREPFDLAEVAALVLDIYRPQAEARGLDITAALAPAPVTGDPRLAERLVANLTDNALRYNVPGGRVEVRTGTRDGRGLVSVANTGPPVPADQVQRLLQPFQRLSPDRAGEPGGSGLGLSIVTAIAKAHEAAISARPGRDGGLSIEAAFGPPAAGPDGFPVFSWRTAHSATL
jgi:signal transduction histidine kinase